MKQLILILSFLLFSCFSVVNAETTPIPITKGDPGTKNNGKGHRMPSCQILLYIDFDNEIVSFSDSTNMDEIIAYEIWDEEMSFCSVNSSEVSIFINELKYITGSVIIIIRTTEQVYYGFY